MSDNRDKQNKQDKQPKYQISQTAIDALHDAEMLVYYCSETGKNISKNSLETIIDAKEKYAIEKWDSRIEKDFLVAYSEVATLIKPMNVDSLRAAHETEIVNPNLITKLLKIKKRPTLANRAVRKYIALAIIVMIVMLVLHIYLSVGTIRLNKIQTSNENIKKLELQLDDIELLSSNSVNLSIQQKKDRLQNELYEINTEKESNITLLKDWVRLIFSSNQTDDEVDVNNQQAEANMPPGPELSPESAMNDNIEIIQQAQNYVLVIGLYFLPLLYGFLGAMTYVLRSLSYQNRAMKFTKESNINHILRLILGTIAGLAVGVFWGDLKQQDNFALISSLGPLLVAFLAGLTVEYVFNGIERFVSSWFRKLGNKEEEQQIKN